MMRILMTGATGFIGSHLARYLLARGCQVAAIVRPQSDVWRIEDVLPSMRVIHGDLDNIATVAESIADFAPDVTLHFAWYGVANNFRNDPRQITSLHASLNLFHAVHAAGCNTWIGLGSQAEYGVHNRRIDENAPTSPTTLYGTVKLCTGLLIRHLCELYGKRFVWFRLFSAYGPADNSNWFIPSLIQTLMRGECLALTKGEQRWDYLFVQDAVEAIYRTMINPTATGMINLGSGQAYAIKSIAEYIRDMIDPNLPLGFGQIPYRPDQIMLLEADIAKLMKLADWVPQTGLKDGLQRTLDWHLQRKGIVSGG